MYTIESPLVVGWISRWIYPLIISHSYEKWLIYRWLNYWFTELKPCDSPVRKQWNNQRVSNLKYNSILKFPIGCACIPH